MSESYLPAHQNGYLPVQQSSYQVSDSDLQSTYAEPISHNTYVEEQSSHSAYAEPAIHNTYTEQVSHSQYAEPAAHSHYSGLAAHSTYAAPSPPSDFVPSPLISTNTENLPVENIHVTYENAQSGSQSGWNTHQATEQHVYQPEPPRTRTVEEVQTIIKQVPVPYERPVYIDNPIYTPRERPIKVERPVPVVKHVPQPIAIHVEEPVPVYDVKHLHVPQPYVQNIPIIIQRVFVPRKQQHHGHRHDNGGANVNRVLSIIKSVGW